MNARDCEEIGLNLATLLTDSMDVDGFVNSMCELDPRIRENFDSYSETAEIEAEIVEEINDEMARRLGSQWAITKAARSLYPKVSAEVREKHASRPYE